MIKKLKDGEQIPFSDHLGELRTRLIHCIGVVFVIFMATWAVSDRLMVPFTSLFPAGKLVFISPTEAFFVHMKIAFYAAGILSLPFFLYHAWAFLAPGLMKKEKKYLSAFVFFSTLFFTSGALFCFHLILPYGLSFLLGFGGETLLPMLSISAVITFCLNLMLVFGIVFQLPIVVIFLNMAGIVTIDQLASFRSYLAVAAFFISAVITPPDVFTQIVLALPIIFLYEASIIVLRITARSAKKKSDQIPIDQIEEQ